MEQSTQHNPLKQFFRQFKLFIKLPSGTSYYSPDIIKFTDAGEVGILPMTGKDELALKNPDGLLNGESLIEVLSSCVPALKQPRSLLTNDIDALITAIRHATFENNIETTINCPSCNHENNFRLDLSYALNNMNFLEPEYTINLDSGLIVHVKPYSFPDILRGLHAQFEQSKLSKSFENSALSESDRSAIFGKAFKELSNLTFELILNSIIKITDNNEVNVTDKKYIKEFLFNIDKKSVDKIADLVKEINTIGIKKTFTATCSECGHSWESEIDFNPVNFS